jgi:hypothetical protein
LPADRELRRELIELLDGVNAHLRFEDVVSVFPARFRGEQVKGLPHSAWMLVEHMRIAQWDILEFSRNKSHVSPRFPEGYWPKISSPAGARAWTQSIGHFKRDLAAMKELVENPRTDLTARIPWGEGQTILREAMLVADHNAYHLGQLLDLARLFGLWK